MGCAILGILQLLEENKTVLPLVLCKYFELMRRRAILQSRHLPPTVVLTRI